MWRRERRQRSRSQPHRSLGRCGSDRASLRGRHGGSYYLILAIWMWWWWGVEGRPATVLGPTLLEPSYFATLLDTVYAPASRATAGRGASVGASMRREHASPESWAPQNYLILQGCFSYRGCSHVLSPTDGVRRSGTKRSAALYQEWLVRFGFWIYGDLGGGGPARDVRHRMEKQRDLGVWLRINCLAALPPMAAVFHAFSFPPALPSGRGQHRASVHRAHGLPSTSHREIAAVTRQTHRLTAASPS